MMKKCTVCKKIKEKTDFYKRFSHKEWVVAQCKECTSVLRKKYYQKKTKDIPRRNKKTFIKSYGNKKLYLLEYRRKNAEILKEKARLYRMKNKEIIAKKLKIYIRKRFKEDPAFKLMYVLRNRLKMVFKLKNLRKRKNKFNTSLGCSFPELKIHIEAQFQPGMTWENHGRFGWHLDHIIPLSSAKTQEEMYKLCHYSNIQPIWLKNHLHKTKKDIQFIRKNR